MNFLAHLYLSGKNEQLQIGGFIADSVKGRDYNDYPEQIKKGILLHRKIDEFTDSHPAIISCKHLLRKPYRKYSGIVVDIFFDHFLAYNWSNFSNISLSDFAETSYKNLTDNIDILPDKVREFLPFAIKNNWLVMYSTVDGIEKILQRMPNRTSLPGESKEGIRILTENYNQFRNYFFLFFHDAIEYVSTEHKIEILLPESSAKTI